MGNVIEEARIVFVLRIVSNIETRNVLNRGDRKFMTIQLNVRNAMPYCIAEKTLTNVSIDLLYKVMSK